MTAFDNLVKLAAEAQYKRFTEHAAMLGAPKPPWQAVTEPAKSIWTEDQRAALESIELPFLLEQLQRATTNAEYVCMEAAASETDCGECQGCALAAIHEWFKGASE